MIVQHKPMRWPPNCVVDWSDASAWGAWVVELREHVFDLFVVGLDAAQPPRQRTWTRQQAQESLLANEKVLDHMLYLSGAPLDSWRSLHLPLPPPPRADAPFDVASPAVRLYQALPRGAWSAEERAKWRGYVEEDLEYLSALLLQAYPEEREEHRRARWAVIRLRVFFDKVLQALAAALMDR
jgi:hypothetical protein